MFGTTSDWTNRRTASRIASCSSDHSNTADLLDPLVGTIPRSLVDAMPPPGPDPRLTAGDVQSSRANPETRGTPRADTVRTVGRSAVLRRPRRSLLRRGGGRPRAGPHVPRGRDRVQGASCPVPDAVLGWADHVQRAAGRPPPADAARALRYRAAGSRSLAAAHDFVRPGCRHAGRRRAAIARVPGHGRQQLGQRSDVARWPVGRPRPQGSTSGPWGAGSGPGSSEHGAAPAAKEPRAAKYDRSA